MKTIFINSFQKRLMEIIIRHQKDALLNDLVLFLGDKDNPDLTIMSQITILENPLGDIIATFSPRDYPDRIALYDSEINILKTYTLPLTNKYSEFKVVSLNAYNYEAYVERILNANEDNIISEKYATDVSLSAGYAITNQPKSSIRICTKTVYTDIDLFKNVDNFLFMHLVFPISLYGIEFEISVYDTIIRMYKSLQTSTAFSLMADFSEGYTNINSIDSNVRNTCDVLTQVEVSNKCFPVIGTTTKDNVLHIIAVSETATENVISADAFIDIVEKYEESLPDDTDMTFLFNIDGIIVTSGGVENILCTVKPKLTDSPVVPTLDKPKYLH